MASAVIRVSVQKSTAEPPEASEIVQKEWGKYDG
jgi:hypothetical protein